MAHLRADLHRITLPLSILCLCFVPRTLAETWIYPLPNTNPIYNKTDTLIANWATPFPEPHMVLWCQSTGDSTSTAEFNISVPSAGSQAIDLSKYSSRTLDCHLEVAQADLGLPSLNSTNFHINDMESNPLVTWRLPDVSATASASAISSTPVTSSQSATTLSVTPFARPTSSSTIARRMAQAADSSSASHQTNSDPSGLSTGTIVGVTLGIVIVVVTIIATVWYVWRCHCTMEARELENLAAVKAAELESSRAVSEIDSVHARGMKFNYPVGVGEDQPPSHDLENRPYWGRPF